MVIQRLRPLFSGQGVQVEALSKELAGRGTAVTIVTAGRGRGTARENVDGYRVRRLRCDIPIVSGWLRRARFRNEIFAARTLAWLLGPGRRTKIVHVHALTDALLTTWLVCRLRGIPIIFEMTLLGTDDPRSVREQRNLFHRLRYSVYSRCDAYVAISPALAAAYGRAALPAEKLRMIPQGVDTGRFTPATDRRALRRRRGLPEEGRLVAFVGSLIERKGIDVLLGAWSLVHERFPTASLLLVGKNVFDDDPEAQQFLERQLGALSESARDTVHPLGVRDDVHELLQASDVFALPSRREGFGTVMIEAMACGLPCVVTRLEGITDFIFAEADDGAPGIVCDQDDPDGFAAAIMELLASNETATALGSRARSRAVERFAIGGIADRYLELYKKLGKPDSSS